jgi:hypothetical protein
MAKQKMLIDVPQDELGKEASACLRLIEEQNQLKEKVQNAGECLIANMREANRLTIFVEGKRVSVKFIESKEKIKVEG